MVATMDCTAEAAAEKVPPKTAFQLGLPVLRLQPKNGFLGACRQEHLQDHNSNEQIGLPTALCNSPKKARRYSDNNFLPDGGNCGWHCKPARPQTVTHLVLPVGLQKLPEDEEKTGSQSVAATHTTHSPVLLAVCSIAGLERHTPQNAPHLLQHEGLESAVQIVAVSHTTHSPILLAAGSIAGLE